MIHLEYDGASLMFFKVFDEEGHWLEYCPGGGRQDGAAAGAGPALGPADSSSTCSSLRARDRCADSRFDSLRFRFLSSVSAAGGARVASEPANDDVTGSGEAISLHHLITLLCFLHEQIFKTIYNKQVNSLV